VRNAGRSTARRFIFPLRGRSFGRTAAGLRYFANLLANARVGEEDRVFGLGLDLGDMAEQHLAGRGLANDVLNLGIGFDRT